MIITFLIILFVQGLNCFLEIGFLANNLEESNLRKYRIIGSQMERKLNKSLAFGKPLDQINHKRLLADIIPADIENLYITDTSGTVIFSAKEKPSSESFRIFQVVAREKTPEFYRIHIPLSDETQVAGNIVMVVSHREIKEKLFLLIRKSVFTFVVIVAACLPILYLLLSWFVNRPYYRFIKDMEIWMQKGEYHLLQKNGVDLSPLTAAEEQIRQTRSGQWFSPENRTLYDAIDGLQLKKDRHFWETDLYQQLKARMNIN
jgi:hypothetical protein